MRLIAGISLVAFVLFSDRAFAWTTPTPDQQQKAAGDAGNIPANPDPKAPATAYRVHPQTGEVDWNHTTPHNQPPQLSHCDLKVWDIQKCDYIYGKGKWHPWRPKTLKKRPSLQHWLLS